MPIRNLSIPVRAALCFAIMASLLIILGSFSLSKLRDIRSFSVELKDDSMASVTLINRLNTTGLKLLLESRRLVAQSNTQDKNTTIQNIQNFHEDAIKLLNLYAPNIKSDEERQAFDIIDAGILRLTKLAEDCVKLSKLDQNIEASVLLDEHVPLNKTLQRAIDKLVELNINKANQLGINSDRAYSDGLTFITSTIFLSLLVTTSLAFAFTRSIVVPLNYALSINESIAKGELKNNIIITGSDELSTLIKSARNMQENLRNIISLINDGSANLTIAAKEMSTVTEKSSQALQQQNTNIELAATAVKQMTTAVNEVAQKASSASVAAQSSEELTKIGTNRVQRTIRAIEVLTSAVENTSSEVQKLTAQSQDIRTVLDVIRAIAEQTNLLALNAAIEAARAGEQGRGFAVVADEVRALAHRTTVSTAEIEQIIYKITAGTEQVTEAMLKSCSETKETLKVATEAGTAISQIEKTIYEINEINYLIATGSKQQAQVTRSVNDNLENIRESSIISATGALTTSASGANLSRLAADMNSLVARFHIS